ncbi:MAG: hypothetical protein JXA33_20745, partial [Anaerolineae bacterium]|nr:hypothetical protein [Anaerolineae bacterium]
MSTTKLTRIVYWGLSLFLMLGMWLFSQPSIARAGTITVTNTLDDGTGSLRQAIAGAASSDTIVFDDSLSGLTITLTSTLAITQNLMIDGSELTTSVTLDGNNTVRIFKVANNAHFTLADVILTQGRDPSTECDSQTFYAPEWVSCGGGIKIEPGSVVTATNITVQRSHAYMGGGIYNAGTLLIRHSDILSNTSGEGGGIHNTHYNVAIGALTVQTCTIAGNTADAASLAGINAGLNTGGGGIYDYDGSVTVQDSTLSGNVAASPSDGGGIWSLYGSVLVQNSTLSGNSAPYGGGIYNYHATVTLQNSTLVGNTSSWHSGGIHAFYGTLHYQNTLMADNVGGDCGYTFSGPIGTNINNWVKDGGCSPAFSGDPFVGPLADNGGETLTHLLSPFSLAVDAGDAATSRPTDQRGMSRPMNAGYDIGAVEVVTQPLFRFSYAVPPSNTVPYYGGIVTYTLVLTNISSVDEPDMRFITTLPDNVTGGGWVTPTDGLMTQNTYTATFAIPAGMTRTLIFTATHDYGLHFANTVYFSNTAYNQPFPLNAGAACAPIFFVRNSNDSGPDSLRQGLTDVCAGGLITFAQDAAVYLNSELATAGAVTIDGSGYAITLSGDSGNDGSRNVRVLNIGAGHSVTLSHLSLVNGIAASGGGIYNAGLLNMTALTLTGNLANGGFDDNHGGALYNAGTVQAQDSQFTNNQADSIYSNRYGRGGGIYNAAGKTITLTHCTIASNQIPHTLAEGGGGYNAGTLTLHECTIADNQAVDGNGVFNTGALQVNGSTFSGNVRYSYDVGYGGALNHAGGAAWIQNSTFSGNRASYGGGIYNTSALTVQNSTLTGNEAIYYNYGGGLRLESGSAYLYNTLIANSTYGDCITAGGVISANVHNLLEDGSCGAAFSGDPAIGPLGDNGGSTATAPLLPASLAIDAGDPATCLPTDQRGVTRPQNGACDIGAVEAPQQPVVRLAKTVTPTL